MNTLWYWKRKKETTKLMEDGLEKLNNKAYAMTVNKDEALN